MDRPNRFVLNVTTSREDYVFTDSHRHHNMLYEKFEVFKAQDPQKGHFDFALEIHGKKLYVHKFFLATASEYFDALLSGRWNVVDNDNVIKIECPDYSYDSFFEFISFIYYGECKITVENVYILTDMAEYYGIKDLKKECDQFLTEDIEITNENYQQMMEFAEKYSLKELSEALQDFLGEEELQ